MVGGGKETNVYITPDIKLLYFSTDVKNLWLYRKPTLSIFTNIALSQ
jgi:hypothetical protein